MRNFLKGNLISLFLFLFMFLLANSSPVSAQEKKWYFLAGGSVSVWSSDKWSDCSYVGDCVTSHSNARLEEFNSHVVGVGRLLEKFSLEMSYEDKTRTKWKADRTVQTNGTIAQSAQANFETKNIMLQLNKDLMSSEDINLYGLLGVGKSEHYNDTAFLVVSGTKVEYADPHTVDTVSYRVGMGLNSKIRDNLMLDGRFFYTDYGDAEVYDNVKNSVSYSVGMKSLDVGLYLRVLF